MPNIIVHQVGLSYCSKWPTTSSKLPQFYHTTLNIRSVGSTTAHSINTCFIFHYKTILRLLRFLLLLLFLDSLWLYHNCPQTGWFLMWSGKTLNYWSRRTTLLRWEKKPSLLCSHVLFVFWFRVSRVWLCFSLATRRSLYFLLFL